MWKISCEFPCSFFLSFPVVFRIFLTALGYPSLRSLICIFSSPYSYHVLLVPSSPSLLLWQNFLSEDISLQFFLPYPPRLIWISSKVILFFLYSSSSSNIPLYLSSMVFNLSLSSSSLPFQNLRVMYVS